jgi:hypothetical protein
LLSALWELSALWDAAFDQGLVKPSARLCYGNGE